MMPTSSPSDRESFWLELIDRRKTLQLTVREVCDQARVSQASFFHWQKRLRGVKRQQGRDVARTAPLVPVGIVDDRGGEITLELPNGMRLRIPQGCEEATLQRVVRVVMAASREVESC